MDDDEPRWERAPFDFELIPDLMDDASAFSGPPLSMGRPALELRGLSVFEPGILDLIELRNDRDDSLVSVLLKDGYFSRSIAGPPSLSPPFLSFDG